MAPPVNELHAALRRLPLQDAINYVHNEIALRGHDAVKRDPGVQAWVMENQQVLGERARTGGLGGDRKL